MSENVEAILMATAVFGVVVLTGIFIVLIQIRDVLEKRKP